MPVLRRALRPSIVALGLACLLASLPATADARPEPADPPGRPDVPGAPGRVRQPVPEDRYALAGGCWAVESLATGGYVARAGDGWAAPWPERTASWRTAAQPAARQIAAASSTSRDAATPWPLVLVAGAALGGASVAVRRRWRT